jgi:polysaccharide chain length determinant protein (PEP-CTERM system associated)
MINEVFGKYLHILKQEVLIHRGKVTLGFALISFTVLIAGVFWPEKFESAVTIYADQENIIKPLLEGKASVTKIEDSAKVVREVIYSPRLLRRVVEEIDGLTAEQSPIDVERRVNDLRGKIKVEALSGNYIKITYSDQKADSTYKILNKVIDLFIADSSASKRSESKEAYTFIDKQVKTYKDQLLAAEEKLKQFQSSNTDGSEQSVAGRIGQMRSDIEKIKLDVEESTVRVNSIQRQLSGEQQFVGRRQRTDVYRERLEQLEARKDALLMTVKEDHPDVVDAKYQIEDLKKTILEVEAAPAEPQSSDAGLNPLYESMRKALADAKVELTLRERRQKAIEKMLQTEYERAKRVATREAEFSELTRDYTVTKDIYNELLGRKEKARLSMTLDVEGKGVSYKIQEPASYPLAPVGLRFLYFFMLGPILGLMLPLGLIFVYVNADPRIRMAEQLEKLTSIPVLTSIPRISTPFSLRVVRADFLLMLLVLFLVVAIYVTVAVLKILGMI